MIVYHGTTEKRARRICREGFLPKKPSRRVWFAEARGYALGRARTQARRTHDRPVVLVCDINIGHARERYGRGKVLHRNGVIAIDGAMPVSVLRSYPGRADTPASPYELANWVNWLLGLKRHKGVSPRHEGLQRLSQWVVNRLRTRENVRIRSSELVGKARQWLPEYFEDFIVDPERLSVYRRVKTIEIETGIAGVAPVQESRALKYLEDPKPTKRARGLAILADIGDPDLFDWCTMFLEDESVNVRVAALRVMRECDRIDPDVVEPLTASGSKRIRAAATAAMAKHAVDEAEKIRWFKHALTDPSPCVRIEAARLLPELDPSEHKSVFRIALHDPNREVSGRARKLTQGKGYSTWRK